MGLWLSRSKRYLDMVEIADSNSASPILGIVMCRGNEDYEHLYGFCQAIDSLLRSMDKLKEYHERFPVETEVFSFCPMCGEKLYTDKFLD